MRRLLLLLLALALAAPAVAWATEGHDEENKAQTAQALAVQALALILAHPPPHNEAVEKLDEALAADVKGEIDLRALRGRTPPCTTRTSWPRAGSSSAPSRARARTSSA